MESSWGLVVWEATGKGAASVSVKSPGQKASCKEVETWHYEKSLGKTLGESATQLQQSTPVFWMCQYHRMTNNSNHSGVEPMELRRQAVCAAEGQARAVTQAPWKSLQDYGQTPNNWTLSCLYCWSLVWLSSDCDYALVLPSWRRYLL